MKNKPLQTKRQPRKNNRKLHASLNRPRRKQRAAAAASADELESSVPNSSISRTILVIFLMHVVVVAAVYASYQWNKGRKVSSHTIAQPAKPVVDIRGVNATLPTALVMPGDTYAVFAERHGVNEGELRRVNNNAPLKPNTQCFLPAPKVTASNENVAQVSDRPPLDTEAYTKREPSVATAVAQPAAEAAKPVLVRVTPVVEASGNTYKVQPGDTIWGIKTKHKVSQQSLMKLNNLKSARDLKAGMTLQIPTL